VNKFDKSLITFSNSDNSNKKCHWFTINFI